MSAGPTCVDRDVYAMGETLEEIKRFIFEVELSPEELERLKVQEAIREGDRLRYEMKPIRGLYAKHLRL